MHTIVITSDLNFILPGRIIRGTVSLELEGRRTAFELEVLNPDPNSELPPEAKFRREGIEILHVKPEELDLESLTPLQRALLSVSHPMFDAGARVYIESCGRLADGAFPVSREIIKATSSEMSMGRSYSTEGQIDDNVATALGSLFV